MVFGGAERRGLGGMRWNVQCTPPARLHPQYYSLQNTSRRSRHIPSALHPQKLGLDADEVGDGDDRPLALNRSVFKVVLGGYSHNAPGLHVFPVVVDL